MTKWDVIVIGGGAAGLSAAQMLGRARRRTLVLDTGSPRNRFADHMHGVLGNDGTRPADLVARGREELERYGVVLREAAVTRVDETEREVVVTLDDGSAEHARALVIATGISDELPPIPGIADHWGSGVLHCPYCHGWEVRDRNLGVLMVSPLQAHQAELVRQWSDDVVVFGTVEPAVRARLHARGVEIEETPVVEVLGDEQVTGVRLEDGRTVPMDALFTMGTPRPHDAFVAHLGLERSDTPVGSFLTVDPAGRTSSSRIWATGNVVAPMATVPVAMGAGSTTGAAVNWALVEEDAQEAVMASPRQFWNGRYAAQMWSGKPNHTLVDLVADLPPGRVLDIGCGEGADVIWLAQHGWEAVGVDISDNAVARAAEHAADAGVAARFVASEDLPAADVGGPFDLVTASFFHSPVDFDRIGILRRASELVASGGRLLVISHAAMPSWAPEGHDHPFPSPEAELTELALDDTAWTVERVETRTRPATAPDGTASELDDAVILLRREAD
ncbi:FAD-dependent oxidoreductase [Microbacterium koreense]|uniref:FAD-dependent oxidoreductase n=1 Tax=Microbacterium koreense TaxID=323761 RepID=A0ABW2ZQR3_9MICO